MLSYSKNIFQKLTGKISLEEVSAEELSELAEKYPYFGAARFFLAKKLSAGNNEAYKTSVEKAALHFNNSLWLDFILHTDIEENEKEADVIEINESIPHSNEKEIFNNVEDIDDDFNEEDDDTSVAVEAESIINEKLSNLLKEQATEFEKPVEQTETLPIENTPYHRIDYFDSQGIKLDTEKEDADKLGKRLRRFTDWLKEMKSINPNLTNVETDVAGEMQAQNMAARSNEPKEVVTEAMAEVLVKQGKPQQAIQVYKKLSFSNPSKSAYFAAKIQDLKGT